MRRILSNILLLLFRYHPNGVLECVEMQIGMYYHDNNTSNKPKSYGSFLSIR